jgi:hypothetical protein
MAGTTYVAAIVVGSELYNEQVALPDATVAVMAGIVAD